MAGDRSSGGTPAHSRPHDRIPSDDDPPRPQIGPLAATLLNAMWGGVALATRAGEMLWTNDYVASLSSSLQERIRNACRLYDRKHPAVPEGHRPTTPDGHPLPLPRIDSVLAEDERFFELAIFPAPEDAMATTTEDPNLLRSGLIVILREVSATKRLQQKINAIDQAGGELIGMDAEAVRQCNAHERLKLLESKITRFSRDLLHFDHFAIRLLDDRSGKLELVLGYGLSPEFDSFEIRPALEGNGISGFVAASGRSYVCPDTAKDDLYLPGVEGAKSSLTIPLKLNDSVIGVMNVESQQPQAFGEEDRQLGEIFARYIAVALHMLDLLVVERSTTNKAISGRVALEIQEPLEDIVHECELLQKENEAEPGFVKHLERIKGDIEAIRRRVTDCAAGPTTLLGVEQALADKTRDPVLAGRRILVADDEPKIRGIIGNVLRNRGCTVVVCEDGARAIDALNAPGDPGFDMILSDIRMPDRNGYEVFSAARKILPDVPVILMTGFGYDPHHSIVRASQEGLQSVLFKPFQVERLIEEVKKALTSPSAG